MTEEEKKAAEAKAKADAEAKARADAEGGTTLDKLLKGIDAVAAKLGSMSTRMDAVEKRMDSEDEKKRADADTAKADARKRADAHRFSKRKDDDDDAGYAKCHDAEEEKLKKHLKDAGEPEETAADKAKKSRKDAEESEAKERADSEEKKRADAASLATKDDLNKLRQDITANLPRSRTDEESAAFADAQARADQAYAVWGKSAPRPLEGESFLAYRRRLLTPLKEHSPHWKGVELTVAATDSALLGVAESQIISDAIKAGMSPTSVAENQLRAIPRTLETGHREIKFVGSPRTWMTRFMHGGQSLSKIRSHKELN